MTSKCIESPPPLPAGRVPAPVHQPLPLRSRLVISGLIALIAAGLAIVYFFDPHHSSFYPLCVFHKLTGLQCPGCGSLRGMYELLHGRFLAALHDNALLMLTLPFLMWLGGRYLLQLALGRSTMAITIRPTWLWIWLGAMLVFTVLRNFSAFSWLSP